jgi:hypothetical protein
MSYKESFNKPTRLLYPPCCVHQHKKSFITFRTGSKILKAFKYQEGATFRDKIKGKLLVAMSL